MIDPGRKRLDWIFAALFCGVVLLGFALRLPGLETKPLHSDEGLFGFSSLRIDWWKWFRYRPRSYHGPFLFYLNAAFFRLLGASEFSLRLGPAIVGGLIPLALIPAKRLLGRSGVLATSLLLATSPVFVYFSRNCIMEIYLIFFSLLWVVFLALFAARPRLWFAVAAAVSAGFAFSTKENAVITGACLAAGAAVAWAFGRPLHGRPNPASECPGSDLFDGMSRREAVKSWISSLPRSAIVGVGSFGLVVVVFFSSFFSNWEGVGSFFLAFFAWGGRGFDDPIQIKRFGYFIDVLVWTQGPFLYVGLAAGTWAILSRNRAGLALLVWAITALLVYSIVPYKTPWCVMNIDLPVLLLGGWAVHELWRRLCRFRGMAPRMVLGVAMSVAFLTATIPFVRETISVNRDEYDNPAIPYIYGQTIRSYYDLVSTIVHCSNLAPDRIDDRGLRIINFTETEPLRFLLVTRGWDYRRLSRIFEPPSSTNIRDAEVVLANASDYLLVASVMRASEWQYSNFGARQGFRIGVWIRREIWDAYASAGSLPFPPAVEIKRPPRPPEIGSS